MGDQRGTGSIYSGGKGRGTYLTTLGGIRLWEPYSLHITGKKYGGSQTASSKVTME